MDCPRWTRLVYSWIKIICAHMTNFACNLLTAVQPAYSLPFLSDAASQDRPICVYCVFQPQITLFVHTPEIEFVDSKVHGKLILSVLHCVFILSYFCFWVSAKLRQLWKAYNMYNQHTLLNWQKCGSLSQIPLLQLDRAAYCIEIISNLQWSFCPVIKKFLF